MTPFPSPFPSPSPRRCGILLSGEGLNSLRCLLGLRGVGETLDKLPVSGDCELVFSVLLQVPPDLEPSPRHLFRRQCLGLQGGFSLLRWGPGLALAYELCVKPTFYTGRMALR